LLSIRLSIRLMLAARCRRPRLCRERRSANCMMRCAENRPASPKEAFHGIDPDYRCATAAVWRRRRLPWSQSRLLVIEGGFDRAKTGITGPGSSRGLLMGNIPCRSRARPWMNRSDGRQRDMYERIFYFKEVPHV